MTRLSTLLLLLAACQPAAAAQTIPKSRADTTRFLDSTKVGDTMDFSRGRVITTVDVRVDSQWRRFPPLPALAALGMPNGLFHLPLDSLCKDLGYNAAHLNAYAPNLRRDLDKVRTCKGRVTLGLLRSRMKAAHDTGLSVANGIAEIRAWDSAAVAKAVNDGTILAIYAADDITATEWGKASQALRMARWDSIYGEIRRRWPHAATAIRAKPAEIAGYPMPHVTTAWAQYRGPYRDGSPQQFLTINVGAARAQQRGLVVGVNPLAGGCGPPILPFTGKPNTSCLPGVPGSPILGTFGNSAEVRRFQLSAPEMLYYKTVFMTDSLARFVCASIDWQWSPLYGSPTATLTTRLKEIRAFHTLPGIKVTAKALAVVAKSRTPASCVHPDRR